MVVSINCDGNKLWSKQFGDDQDDWGYSGQQTRWAKNSGLDILEVAVMMPAIPFNIPVTAVL